MRISQLISLSLLSAACLQVGAQEATIRKNLASRLPDLPKIEEVRKTPMAGLYEVRVNHSDIFYTDAKGDFLIQGAVLDTKTKVDLTDQRINKLTAVAFVDLPFKDSFSIVRGDGKRQMAVFEDPNCGFCKKFERDLTKVDNVTVHVFLYPVLGADSSEKSTHIWCAKDKAKAFLDWMVREVSPPVTSCDSAAVTRNLEFGKKNRITGTPTMIFPDGTRVPGAIGADRIEKLLGGSKP